MELIFDIKKLDNLRTLHEYEEQLRGECLARIAADPKQAELMFLVTNAMGILFGFTHDHKAESDNELTVQMLGLRLFNDAACSLKLGLSGYSQQAIALVRDIVEVGFLLDYFRSFPGEIAAWKVADPKTRQNKYGPFAVRKVLDERDGNVERKRDRVYKMLCEHATHATYPGFKLAVKDGSGQVGPFLDDMKIKGWLQELTLRILPCAELIGTLCPNASAEVRGLYDAFRKQTVEWWTRVQ